MNKGAACFPCFDRRVLMGVFRLSVSKNQRRAEVDGRGTRRERVQGECRASTLRPRFHITSDTLAFSFARTDEVGAIVAVPVGDTVTQARKVVARARA